MAVRNFWIDADIDGRKTELSGGPASKEGGMTVVIKQRDEGNIVRALKVYCYESDGELFMEAFDTDNKPVCKFVTKR